MSSRYDVDRPNRIPSENRNGVGPVRTYPPHVSPKGPSAFVLGITKHRDPHPVDAQRGNVRGGLVTAESLSRVSSGAERG